VLETAKRRVISVGLLVVLILLSVYFWRSIPGAIPDGVYNATAESYGGPLTLAVTIADGKIVEIEIVEHNDTPFVASGAIATIIPAIIEAQSADVDVVGGATMTSTAIKDAVRQVLTENK